jgi:hypothetical protein
MNNPERLRRVVSDVHDCEAEHVGTEKVQEEFDGGIVWMGEVEIFSLIEHPTATSAFAWTFLGDDDADHHVTVLGQPPINSALDAVRTLVAEAASRDELAAGARRKIAILAGVKMLELALEVKDDPEEFMTVLDQVPKWLFSDIYPEAGRKAQADAPKTLGALKELAEGGYEPAAQLLFDILQNNPSLQSVFADKKDA